MSSNSLIQVFRVFPTWVPKSSKLVNALLIATSFSTATVLGYDASMMNALNILPSYTEYFDLTSATIGLNSGIVWIGAIIGSLLSAKIPDTIGRRPALFYSAIVAAIGTALQASSQNISMFLVARFILGLGVGGTYVATPLLLAETSAMQYRTFSLGAFTDLYYVGGLLSSGITYGTSAMDSTWAWRLPSLLQLVFTFISVLTLPFVPESPRYLVYQGRRRDALQAIASACSDGDTTAATVQAQYIQIIESLEFEKNMEPPSIKEIATKAPLRKRMLIVLSCAVFSMFTGNNIFSYYLGTALDNAGITDSTLQLEINIILNAFCLVVSIIGTLIADRVGRKMLASISTSLCIVFLFIIGALTKIYGTSTYQPAIYANVAMMFLAMGSYSLAWTPISFIYPPEILNYQIRNIGMAWFGVWQNLILLIPIFAFPIAIEAIGWKIYMLNGAWDVFELVVIIFYWVETRNLSLEEVSALFDGEVHSQVTGINGILHGEPANIDDKEVARVAIAGEAEK
ncbi:putative Major facilitator superfamily (MFS) profile domain-containing protein [Seiridium unicorne]|uniref:Major facilitator superfamily (MFS) profile domain-containing protein n=1 Tax=Seiridium unicorne TaxID=138068 RepID=A0ABR2UTF5_9PEZI